MDQPKQYTLNFEGYWREPNIGGLPTASGIYCVYACTYNGQNNTVNITRLLYIGESENVRERVANHEKWPVWRSKLRSGEEICFNSALIGGTPDRQRAEAAMISEHKPLFGVNYYFPWRQLELPFAWGGMCNGRSRPVTSST